MAAAGARTMRVVKPHVPLIKFPNRKVKAEPLKMVDAFIPKLEPISAASPVVTSKPVGRMPRGSGIEWSQLPAKYHRKPLSQEEIDFIECPLGAANLYLVTPSAAPRVSSTSSSSTRKMPQGSGIEWSQMPEKYHRKQLTAEEIEFIEIKKISEGPELLTDEWTDPSSKLTAPDLAFRNLLTKESLS